MDRKRIEDDRRRLLDNNDGYLIEIKNLYDQIENLRQHINRNETKVRMMNKLLEANDDTREREAGRPLE